MIVWATGLLMSPHGESTAGDEHVRTTVVTFLRNTAIGTLVLVALAAWMLFPRKLGRWPVRDWLVVGLMAILAATAIYQLVWLQTAVL